MSNAKFAIGSIDDVIAALPPEWTTLDGLGRAWRLSGAPFFDEKAGTQGRWKAVFRMVEEPTRVCVLNRATPHTPQTPRLPS